MFNRRFVFRKAGWDTKNHCLIEQENKQRIQMMPLIEIAPVETHRFNMTNSLLTPIYVISDRRNAMDIGYSMVYVYY